MRARQSPFGNGQGSSRTDTMAVHLKKGMDLIQFLLTFCFFYCLLVFLYFNRYQADPAKTLRGEAAFQPFVYVCSVCCFYLLHQNFMHLKNGKIIVLADAAVIWLSVRLFPIVGERYLLGVVLALYVLTDFFILGKIEKRKDTETELFFSSKYTRYWGAGILLILFAHCITADHDSILPAKAADCTFVLYVSLFIFSVLSVIQKYALYFYRHYHQRKRIDEVVRKQLIRVFSFVMLQTAAAGFFVFSLAAALTWSFAPYFTAFYEVLAAIASILGMPLADSEYASWFNSSGPDIQNFKEVMRYQRNKNDLIPPVLNMILLFLLVIAVFLILFVLYKKIRGISIGHAAEEGDIMVTKGGNEKIDRGNRKPGVFAGAHSPDEKIRRSYGDLVIFKYRTEKLPGLGKLTSGEIKECAADSPEEKALMEEITNTYDAVRYGFVRTNRQQADAFDWKCQKVKRLCKKKSRGRKGSRR